MHYVSPRKLLVMTARSALLALFVGCAAPPAAPAGDTGAAAADATEAPAEEAGDATRLILAQTVDLDGLEPSEVNSRAEANIFGHMYATVYEITETGDIVPYLANDYRSPRTARRYLYPQRRADLP